MATFWAHFGKFGLYFILPSGHTVGSLADTTNREDNNYVAGGHKNQNF